MAAPGEGFGNLNPQQMQQAMLAMAGGMGGMSPPPSEAGGMPQFDPVMAQTYMHMFQYFQGLSQGGMGVPGMPSLPLPLPGMPPAPYTAPPALPSINVSVDGMKFQYQLTEDDLQKVFSRYGAVKSIRVDEGGSSANITFYQHQDCQAAMTDLNGKVLNGLDGVLRISWASTPAAAPPPPPYPSMPFPNWSFPPAATPSWPMPGSSPMPPMPRDVVQRDSPARDHDRDRADSRAQHVKGVRKFTCRFLIGIENDKDFQVARRIIGSKGTNMKKIVKTSDAKLRLRGQGSGYFEGGAQKESSEPLQLCVSCISEEGYVAAVECVKELLKRVYDEYRKFCQEAGKPIPDLKINLSENQLVYSSRGQTLPPGAADFAVDAPDDRPSSVDFRVDKQPRRRNNKPGKTRDPSAEDGVPQERGEPSPLSPSVKEIEKYIDERNEARRANNFAEADRIREFLHARGVALMDEPGGRGRGTEVTTWRYWRD